jgi:hypothetical protein
MQYPLKIVSVYCRNRSERFLPRAATEIFLLSHRNPDAILIIYHTINC